MIQRVAKHGPAVGQLVAPPTKIRVVQILPELESGGVERGTLELAEYLVRQGHESLVISGGGRLVAQLEAGGSEHIEMPLGKKKPASLGYILPLRRLLLERRIDILHLRSRMPAWLAYLAWKTLPCGKRPRLVTTFHGFYSVNRYSAVMTKGERIIAVSRSIAEHIRQNYQVDDQRIVLIHRGVDTKVFNPEAVSSERLKSLQQQWQLAVAKTTSSPLIMLPGRISRWKGHDIFLQALARIKELPWRAICVGDLGENPGYAEHLRQMAIELDLADRVKFTGHCSDMAAALLLADLVVSPASTEAEAFGRVVVEAAAMGKPVIASAHGGSLETVLPGQTGWLVEPNNIPSLTATLREALSNAARLRDYGTAGRKWVGENFTVERMCATTLEVYGDLLNVYSNRTGQ